MDFSVRRSYHSAQAALDAVLVDPDSDPSPRRALRNSPAKAPLWQLDAHGHGVPAPSELQYQSIHGPGTSSGDPQALWTPPSRRHQGSLMSPLLISPSPTPTPRQIPGDLGKRSMTVLQPAPLNLEPVSVTPKPAATHSHDQPTSKRRLMDDHMETLNTANTASDRDCFTDNGVRITQRLLYDMLVDIRTNQTSKVCGRCKRPLRDPEPEVLPEPGERSAVRAAYASGVTRNMKWDWSDGHSLEHPVNDEMNAHIRTTVLATHPLINPQALRKAMQSHFETHKDRAKREEKGTAKATAEKTKRSMRKYTKSKRRVTAVKTKKRWSEEEKKRYKAAMECVDLQSSDDSEKEEGKDIFIPRPLVWISEECCRVKNELDDKAGRRDSQKAANMRHKRRVGPVSTRPPTMRVREEFSWAIAPEYR